MSSKTWVFGIWDWDNRFDHLPQYLVKPQPTPLIAKRCFSIDWEDLGEGPLTSMDKSWIDLNDMSFDQFNYGLEHFLEFAFDNNKCHTRIYCPCKKCYNWYFVTREVARAHIIVDGFMPNYRNWIHHGDTNQPLYSEQGIGNNIPSAFVDDMFDQLNQFNQCLEEREEHEQDEDYREEMFTRVMGPDAHGPVRISSNVNEDNIRKEVERQYKTKIDDLKAKHEFEIEDLRSKYSEVSSKLHLVMTHIGFHVNTTPSGSGQVCMEIVMKSLDHN
ncbi:unnamed protein product [Malus baccata var. baccata]